jgi:hypothetical protein
VRIDQRPVDRDGELATVGRAASGRAIFGCDVGKEDVGFSADQMDILFDAAVIRGWAGHPLQTKTVIVEFGLKRGHDGVSVPPEEGPPMVIRTCFQVSVEDHFLRSRLGRTEQQKGCDSEAGP